MKLNIIINMVLNQSNYTVMRHYMQNTADHNKKLMAEELECGKSFKANILVCCSWL